MADWYDELNDRLVDFIQQQHLFFTGSAPLAGGRVNVSPKGMDVFRVLGPKRVAYLDMTGSGNETAAHLRDNGRLTLMFCSFDQAPNILRLYGRGRTVQRDAPEWAELALRFEMFPGARQIVLLDVEKVFTTCGYGVPYYEYKGERPTLRRYWEKMGAEGTREYQRAKNLTSIDGLPTGLTVE